MIVQFFFGSFFEPSVVHIQGFFWGDTCRQLGSNFDAACFFGVVLGLLDAYFDNFRINFHVIGCFYAVIWGCFEVG